MQHARQRQQPEPWPAGVREAGAALADDDNATLRKLARLLILDDAAPAELWQKLARAWQPAPPAAIGARRGTTYVPGEVRGFVESVAVALAQAGIAADGDGDGGERQADTDARALPLRMLADIERQRAELARREAFALALQAGDALAGAIAATVQHDRAAAAARRQPTKAAIVFARALSRSNRARYGAPLHDVVAIVCRVTLGADFTRRALLRHMAGA